MECFVLDSTATIKTENKIFNTPRILFLIKVKNMKETTEHLNNLSPNNTSCCRRIVAYKPYIHWEFRVQFFPMIELTLFHSKVFKCRLPALEDFLKIFVDTWHISSIETLRILFWKVPSSSYNWSGLPYISPSSVYSLIHLLQWLEFVSLEYTGSLFVCRLIILSGDVKATEFSVWGFSLNHQLFWLFIFLLNKNHLSSEKSKNCHIIFLVSSEPVIWKFFHLMNVWTQL